jgi:cytosol alanyl aminopeptidase
MRPPIFSLPVRFLFALASLFGLTRCEPHVEEPRALPPVLLTRPPPPPATLPAEAPPVGRLPSDARPSHYHLSLSIVPERSRFAGTTQIAVTLNVPRDVIWLHGRDLTIHQASVRPEGLAPIPARWEQVTPAGLAALRLPHPIGPGKVTLRLDYEAPFGERQEGLFHVQRAGKSYAFTQFESIFARRAFPCFDEPAFKTPYDITLFVPQGQEGISNTREIERAPAQGGLSRITFATTEKLPSYLIAFAVGPLDVVNAPPIAPNAVRSRPLPLRGIATTGRGKEFAYALAHTGEIVSALEAYFGIEYPYDKLDLIAVPERGGAMENAGAITFNEALVLLDEKNAPESQRAGFASVTAHELAHQWFGDLVTMPWWDDIWLNEAFATWMQAHIVQSLWPALRADLRSLEGIHGAMGTDALISARQIRQEIRDDHDIFNAFDAITYQKGSGVIGMFERSIGPEAFRKGISAYLNQHRFGNATSDDLLAALSEAAGRDIATPFRTFLFQPGVPFLDSYLECGGSKPWLVLEQSRFLPIGSTGEDKSLWQIPVCARYPDGDKVKESCRLLTGRVSAIPLEGKASCPAWVMPNADAAGYYRWSLPSSDLKKLAGGGYKKLTTRERMSFAQSLRAGFLKGTTPADDVLRALEPFAVDPSYAVARAPMEVLGTLRDWLSKDPLRTAVEAYGQRLYNPVFKNLGWEPGKGKAEEPEKPRLRRAVITFLANVARDPKIRKEAAARGRAYLGFGTDGAIHPEAIEPDLTGISLAVALEEGDRALFDAALDKLSTTGDEIVRRNLLGALGSVTQPELAAKARELTLDPRVRLDEMRIPLDAQLAHPETQDAAWEWFKGHIDPLMSRLPQGRAIRTVWLGLSFCDQPHKDEMERLFAPKAQAYTGGPREVQNAMEAMSLCIARRKAQEPSARAFFGGQPLGKKSR